MEVQKLTGARGPPGGCRVSRVGILGAPRCRESEGVPRGLRLDPVEAFGKVGQF